MRRRNSGKRRARKQPKLRASSRAHVEVSARDRAAGKWFAKLVALQERLRGPKGCPWDREQTHQSLRKFLIEEAYEVLDAMDAGNPEEFASELGDLFFVCVNIARFLGVDPEIALKKTNRKFKRRFQWMESTAAKEGRLLADLPRRRMEELWNQSKARD